MTSLAANETPPSVTARPATGYVYRSPTGCSRRVVPGHAGTRSDCGKIGLLPDWLTTPLGVLIERWYDLYDEFVAVFDQHIDQLKAQPRLGPYSQYVGQILTLSRQRRSDLYAFIYNAYVGVMTQVQHHALTLLPARGGQGEEDYLSGEVGDLFMHPDSVELCTPLGLLCQQLVDQYGAHIAYLS